MILYVTWKLLTVSQKEKLKKLANTPLEKMRKRRRDKYLQTTLMGTSDGVRKDPKQNSSRTEVTTTEIVLQKEHHQLDVSLKSCDNSLKSCESSLKSCDSEDNLEALLERAQTQNTYRSTSRTNPPQELTPYQLEIHTHSTNDRRESQWSDQDKRASSRASHLNRDLSCKDRDTKRTHALSEFAPPLLGKERDTHYYGSL